MASCMSTSIPPSEGVCDGRSGGGGGTYRPSDRGTEQMNLRRKIEARFLIGKIVERFTDGSPDTSGQK
jgi:hypothetical protein